MLSFPVPQDKGNVGSENEIGVDFWRIFQFAEFIQRGDINCHQLFKRLISQYSEWDLSLRRFSDQFAISAASQDVNKVCSLFN